MAYFWQNQPEMTGHNSHKDAPENTVSTGTSCAYTKTKIEEANALNMQNELEKAYEIYKDILGESTGQADALIGIGTILKKQQKFDLATQFLSRALESNGDKTEALLMRGRIFRQQCKSENAISDFTEVIRQHPDNYEALIARGITFGQISQFNAAINDFSLAVSLNSNCASAFYNRGVVYEKLYEFEAAIKDYSIAIKLNPNDFKAYNNRGVARREIRCFDSALKDFDKSIEIKPDFAEGHYNKSLTLLSVGKLKDGFKLYEHRWKTAHFRSQRRHFPQPLWHGNEDLTGKTILLHSEQGLGDSIQFCRYIKFFENMKCRVLLEIEQPLISLMQCLLPHEYIYRKGSTLPAFDFHCPLMSLPHSFGTTLNDIPFSGPYLAVHQKRIEHWRKLLKKKDKPIIGLAWRGNPHHVNDQRRSSGLIEIIGSLSKEFEWISLERFPTEHEKHLIDKKGHMRQFGDEIGDFAETAALCKAIDAVISVDTSTAHLAASIGTETHLLLRDCADWRWLQGRKDTPWYNAIKIYRRLDKDRWLSVLKAAQFSIATSHNTNA